MSKYAQAVNCYLRPGGRGHRSQLEPYGLAAEPLVGKALQRHEPALRPDVYGAWFHRADRHLMLGITTAPATGKLVSEIVCGAPPHIDPEPFSVRRFQ